MYDCSTLPSKALTNKGAYTAQTIGERMAIPLSGCPLPPCPFHQAAGSWAKAEGSSPPGPPPPRHPSAGHPEGLRLAIPPVHVLGFTVYVVPGRSSFASCIMYCMCIQIYIHISCAHIYIYIQSHIITTNPLQKAAPNNRETYVNMEMRAQTGFRTYQNRSS